MDGQAETLAHKVMECGVERALRGAVMPDRLLDRVRRADEGRTRLDQRPSQAFPERLGGRDEEGQGLAEYALILALIAIIAIVALIFLGTQVSKILSNVGNSV